VKWIGKWIHVDIQADRQADTHIDTRRKIVGAAEAAGIAAAGATVVSGYFDPLIAWHARWLAGFKKPARPLLVLIATPENPILPAAARAELVASLGVVDHVAEFPAEFSKELADMLDPAAELRGGDIGIEIIRIESQDRELFQDLLELVHSRQNGASAKQEPEPGTARDPEQSAEQPPAAPR
jgi:bifunctional ADP-heptose synthase (sugar kinase/adenylyltransferase)